MSDNQHLQSSQAAQTTAVTQGPERRRSVRGKPHGEPSRAELVKLILGTYAEMPALTLRLPQAARLFGLRDTTCRLVLNDLVADGRLRQSADGRYRATSGAR